MVTGRKHGRPDQAAGSAARGVAVLPAGMSQERFDWLDKWTSDPSDIVRTPGTESNVKEIYDACNEMARKCDVPRNRDP